VIGDIRTPLLSIAEGAIFDGTSRMLNKMKDIITNNAMTPDDLAKYLEIETNLVYEWADSGRLPGTKDGSAWKFERAKIDEWVAQGKIK